MLNGIPVEKKSDYSALYAALLAASLVLSGFADSKVFADTKIFADTKVSSQAKAVATAKTTADAKIKAEGKVISDCEPVSDLVAPGQKLRVRKDRSAFIKPESQLSGVVSAPPDVIMDDKYSAKQSTEIAMQAKFRHVHGVMPQVVSPRTSLAGLNKRTY